MSQKPSTRSALLRELSKRMWEVDRARAAAVSIAARTGADAKTQADVQFWVGHYAGLLEAKRVVKEFVR